MHDRFALGLSPQDVRLAVTRGYDDLRIDEWVDQDKFEPWFNMSSRKYVPVILRRAHRYLRGNSNSKSSVAGGPSGGTSQALSGSRNTTSSSSAPTNIVSSGEQATTLNAPTQVATEPPLIMYTMRWDFVPRYKEYDNPVKRPTLYVERESLSLTRWSISKQTNRCAVVCQGFHQWYKMGKEKAQPYFTTHSDGRPMLLAGLWDRVILRGASEPLWTFVIITTPASEDSKLHGQYKHDRQPVIISNNAALSAWLNSPTWSTELEDLCEFNEQGLIRYRVPSEIENVNASSRSFIIPIAERIDGMKAALKRQAEARSKRKRSPEAGPSANNPMPDKQSASEGNPHPETSDLNADVVPQNKSHSKRKHSPARDGTPGPSAKGPMAHKQTASEDQPDPEPIDVNVDRGLESSNTTSEASTSTQRPRKKPDSKDHKVQSFARPSDRPSCVMQPLIALVAFSQGQSCEVVTSNS
ncbi:hypothetical protein C8Q80DRAFT_930697 [Daedaleopsis nitida]|nr:hypothetical protein C8Q80DRAFT_930697 [Daedaleopsis nitida]